LSEDFVYRVAGAFDFLHERFPGPGCACEFSLSSTLVVIVPDFVSDEVPEVAAQVDGYGAYGIVDARQGAPQVAVRRGGHFLTHGVNVAGQDVSDVIQ
jgi:hypothetical protein